MDCINNENGKNKGGYMCAIMLMFSLLLNVSPDIEMEQLIELIRNTENQLAKEILFLFMSLGDIPQPDVYIADKQKNVCLYTKVEFYDEAIDDLSDVASMLEIITNGEYSLQYKKFSIDDEDILYEDPYQVVISKEVYNDRKDNFSYLDLLEDFEDELDEYDDDSE